MEPTNPTPGQNGQNQQPEPIQTNQPGAQVIKPTIIQPDQQTAQADISATEPKPTTTENLNAPAQATRPIELSPTAPPDNLTPSPQPVASPASGQTGPMPNSTEPGTNTNTPNTSPSEEISKPVYPTQTPIASVPATNLTQMASPSVPANPTTTPNNYGSLSTPAKKNKKVLMIVVLATLLIVGLIAAYLLLIFIPNQPDNVWKTGMDRTSQEIETITESLNDKEKFETITKSKFTMNGTAKFSDMDLDIDVTSAYENTDSDSNINIDIDSKDTNKMSLKTQIKTHMPENALLPNFYFKISGISSFLKGSPYEPLNKYENKWIGVEQDFYDKYIQEDELKSTDGQLTHEELVSIINDMSLVTSEYIFTNDQEKAVLVKENFVGKEESEGIKAYHYQVSINEENAKKYCEAMVDRLAANQAVKKSSKLSDEDFDRYVKDYRGECKDASDIYESDEEKKVFDLWIDSKYKLLHKVRFYEDFEEKANQARERKQECIENQKKFNSSSSSEFCDYHEDGLEKGEHYMEFGQIFNNNEELKIFSNVVKDTDKDKSKLNISSTINTETYKFDAKLNFKSEKGKNPGTIDFSMSNEAHDQEIDSTKPNGTISLEQIMRELGMSETPAQNRTSSSLPEGQRLGVNTEESKADSILDSLQEFLDEVKNLATSSN